MKISLDQLKKVELTRSANLAVDAEAVVEAIFKVKKPNYIPHGVRVRAQLDSLMFTGSLKAETLEQIESDPDVESVALSKPLDLIE